MALLLFEERIECKQKYLRHQIIFSYCFQGAYKSQTFTSFPDVGRFLKSEPITMIQPTQMQLVSLK